MQKLGALGFLGLTLPEQYGGSGGDHLAYCLVTEELGRGDSAVRGIVSVSLGLVAKTIAAWGDEEQKRRWLPGLASGELLGCFWGSPSPAPAPTAAGLATRAVREPGGDWVVNGSKMFITNGTWADVVLLFARTNEAPGHRGISAFLVPAGAPGLSRRPVHGKLGLRGQATAELVLQDVRVPAGALTRERRARGSPSPCPPSPRGGCPSPRAVSASRRPRSTPRWGTRGGASSSAGPSRRTSSSRSF